MILQINSFKKIEAAMQLSFDRDAWEVLRKCVFYLTKENSKLQEEINKLKSEKEPTK